MVTNSVHTEFEIAWPVVGFEINAYPFVVHGPEDVLDLYEDDYWDEIVHAFDRENYGIKFEFSAESKTVHVARGDKLPTGEFTKLARFALLRHGGDRGWRRFTKNGKLVERQRIELLNALDEAQLRDAINRQCAT
jgi:hypothetical protein